MFSLWDTNKQEIELFIEQANNFHPTIKFMADISDKDITFLDTVVHNGERFSKESILDIKTHYKPTETFQYTHFTSCHPPGVKRGFIKGEAIRLLRTNSSETAFKESLSKFKTRLTARGYPKHLAPVVQRPDNFIQWISHYPTVSICAKISVFHRVQANMHTLTTV